MIVLAPQPNQSFWHVPPAGNTYRSGPDRRIEPLTSADEAALVALGCTLLEHVRITNVSLPLVATSDAAGEVHDNEASVEASETPVEDV